MAASWQFGGDNDPMCRSRRQAEPVRDEQAFCPQNAKVEDQQRVELRRTLLELRTVIEAKAAMR